MESSIGEFPKIGKFPTLRSPDKSGKNSPALRTNSEIFQGEPLRREFVENVWFMNIYSLSSEVKHPKNFNFLNIFIVNDFGKGANMDF